MASSSATLSDLGVAFPHTLRKDVHRCPAHFHQVGAGSRLERVQPLVHFRYASLPCWPGPGRLAVPARPVFVRAASHPPERLLGQAALSFTGLLRQPDEVGLSPPSGLHGASWRTVSTVKKSHAIMVAACARVNSSQVGPDRRGVGSMP